MAHELALTKANRIRLAMAFRNNERVDLSIDCVVEGQMGRAFADHPDSPGAFRIEVGPFCYLAGDTDRPDVRGLVEDLPSYALLMPSPPEWMALAGMVLGTRLARFPRYSFSTEKLAAPHLDLLLASSKFYDAIERIDLAMAAHMLGDPGGLADLSEYDSAEDFVERGVGFYLMARGTMAGVAYSSLVCSKGIEVSAFVLPRHRRRGIATALTSALLKHCLERNIDPHWDAANRESCRLAEKLGYVQTGTYDAYYLGPAAGG